VQPQSKLEA